MQIPLQCPDDPSQWALFELQGDISSTISTTLRAMHLGDMVQNEPGKVSLTVGNHILRGQKLKLAKPLLVTETVPDPERPGAHVIAVRGVIRWKYLFNQRPHSILGTENEEESRQMFSTPLKA